ncbi:MAG: efflux RND transporter periplasmic adaptor subunit [Alphaproteobacteria bacterium]|nr:efflux RND transporter periplasmic adaptor subunit [Alphaproteobacteria bacterium]
MTRRQIILGSSGALLVAALALGVWLLWPAPKAAPADAAQAPAAVNEADLPQVTVAQVKSVRLAPQASFPGTVMSRNDSKLAADVAGRVEWVAEVGTAVAKGDVIARLDKHMVEMQRDSDKANVTRLEAVVKFDRVHADRMDVLLGKGAVAKTVRDQAISTRDSDVAALAAAKSALERSQYRLDHAEIRAPFAGRVAARLINIGEYANEGHEIVRLVALDEIEISAEVPITSMHYLKENMHVTAMIDSKPVETVVRTVVPVGDHLSRMVEVRLTIAPSSAFVGDAARVLVPSAEPRTVLAVPRDALILREDNTYLFKLDKDKTAQRIAVGTGAEDGELVEVSGTLSEGDHIIVRGAEHLESGQKVRLDTESAARAPQPIANPG